MTTVFADAFFYLALLNRKDQHQAAVVRWAERHPGRFLTSWWVLFEVADGLAASAGRRSGSQLVSSLERNPKMGITPMDDGVLRDALTLYRKRPDKEWTLTDCTSFVVMQRERIREALTRDHHFVQAGYIALFSEPSVA